MPHDSTFLCLSLRAENIRALIVGGGRAALIKARTFIERGCRVTILAPSVREEFAQFAPDCVEIRLASYDAAALAGHHLVVIATDDEAVNAQIQRDCEARDKLYLMCGDAQQGLFVTPVMRETEQAMIAVHTKAGSPRSALFLAEKLAERARQYDAFIAWIADIRQQIKGRGDKDEIMRALNSDAAFKLFMQGRQNELFERSVSDTFERV